MTANGPCERQAKDGTQCGVITGWYDTKKEMWDCGEHRESKHNNLEMTVDKDPRAGMNRKERRYYERTGKILE